jgi:hypothetical protein
MSPIPPVNFRQNALGPSFGRRSELESDALMGFSFRDEDSSLPETLPAAAGSASGLETECEKHDRYSDDEQRDASPAIEHVFSHG